MAKYIGLLSSDARGKLGGIVLSRSRSGTTLKAKTTPKKPVTPAQVSAQASLANAHLAWQTLTADNRTTWAVVAATITWTNSLGGTYSPTGQQLYIQAFINANMQSYVPPDEYPDDPDPPATLTYVGADSGGGELNVFFEFMAGAPSTLVYVYAGRYVRATVNYTATKARTYMGYAYDTDVLNIQALYIRRYGQLPPLYSVLPIRVVPVSASSYISGTVWNAGVSVE
jgi:hypothetical protein